MLRLISLPNSSTPTFLPQSAGDGNKAIILSNKLATPTFLRTLPNKTGTMSPEATPFFKAPAISSGVNGSSMKNFSSNASSVLAISSFNAPLSSATLSAKLAGISATLPSKPT